MMGNSISVNKKPEYKDYYIEPENSFISRRGHDFEQYEKDLQEWEYEQLPNSEPTKQTCDATTDTTDNK